MKIGITIRDDMPDGQLWYSNGISQNIKFIYDLFEVMGHEPFFLTFAKTAPEQWVHQDKTYLAMDFDNVIEQKLDAPLMLEIGVTLNPEHRAPLRELCNSKIVSVRFGNSFVMDIQELVYQRDEIGGLLYVADSDALWISPHFERSKTYFETLFHTKAEVCPYLWEPDFVSEGEITTQEDTAPDIYVMEPNIDVMKTAMIPLCIISRLYQEAPDSFGKATILNGGSFYDKPYFLNNMVRNLPGTGSDVQKVFFSGRVKFDEVFQRRDILLGHQWECGLNYLYCEALYKGIPLVHNSPFYKGQGYFYDDCDVDQGLDAIQQAIENGCNEMKTQENKHFLEGFSIHNKDVQKQYEVLINNALNS